MDTIITWFKNLILIIIIKIIFNFLMLIYSFIFLIGLIILIIKNPTKNIFKVKQRNIPPKVLNDEIYGTHNYVKINDIKLHYVDCGNKTDTVILFLHGFPDFWFSWRYQIMEFSKKFRTIAVDLRGYGGSDKPIDCEYYRPNEITQDILRLLDALSIERCILVAHDWGGLIAWQLAQLHSNRLLKYIIINAPEKTIFWYYLLTSLEQLKKSWKPRNILFPVQTRYRKFDTITNTGFTKEYMFFFQSPYLPEIALTMNDLQNLENIYKTNDKVSILNSEELEAYKYTFGQPEALTPPLNYYRAIQTNAPTSLKNNNPEKFINIPGLMIISDEDKALCKDMLEMSAKTAGGDNIKINIINKAGHFVHQEKPQEVNKVIAEFIY